MEREGRRSLEKKAGALCAIRKDLSLSEWKTGIFKVHNFQRITWDVGGFKATAPALPRWVSRSESNFILWYNSLYYEAAEACLNACCPKWLAPRFPCFSEAADSMRTGRFGITLWLFTRQPRKVRESHSRSHKHRSKQRHNHCWRLLRWAEGEEGEGMKAEIPAERRIWQDHKAGWLWPLGIGPSGSLGWGPWDQGRQRSSHKWFKQAQDKITFCIPCQPCYSIIS